MRRTPVLVFVFALTLRLQAADPDWQAQEGVLVLRNGFVIQGRISVVQDMVLVTTGPGGEVRLPRADVEHLCRTLDEAYLRQRDQLPADDLQARLKLASWCARNRLPHRAADQLLAASLEFPNDPRVVAAEARLLAVAIPKQSSTSTTTNVATSRQPSIAPPLPTPRRLSPELMQQFSLIIQPILLNRCATHTCHGSAGQNDYKLVRPASGHSTTSRMSQRNLQATLAYLDREAPEHSTLLRAAETPHGGLDHPPFQDKQQLAQLELLTSWARRAASPTPDLVSTNRGGPRQGLRNQPSSPAQAVDSKPELDEPSAQNRVVPANFQEPLSAASEDPHDPAEFNRRYHPK